MASELAQAFTGFAKRQDELFKENVPDIADAGAGRKAPKRRRGRAQGSRLR